ncbi:EAL domain-containing protein [Deinococcus sonorensis]|uniref:EAL domain-containing protein n=2 Tax=Deinococcus sonorensis TaxID=309891 RepID=A0AAU7UD48_9DEIO
MPYSHEPPLQTEATPLLLIVGRDGRPIYLSSVLGLLLGGRSLTESLTDPDPALLQAPADGHERRRTVTLRTPDGQLQDFDLSVAALPSLDAVLYHLEPAGRGDRPPRSTALVVVSFRPTLQLVYANAAAQHHAGLDGLELRPDAPPGPGQSAAARRRARHTALLQQAVQERRAVVWLEQYSGPELPVLVLRCSFLPVYGPDGRVLLVIGTGLDLTPELRGQLQAQLLSAVVQDSPDATLVADMQPQLLSGRIQLTNRAARRLLRPWLPLEGRPLGELVRSVLTPEQVEQLSADVRAGQRVSLTLQLAPGTAAERCLELSVLPGSHRPPSPLWGDLLLTGDALPPGELSYLSVTLRDVTLTERIRRLEAGRARTLQLSAGGAGLEQVLTELVQTVEGQLPGQRAAVLLRQAGRWQVACAPQLPAAFVAQLSEQLVELPADPCLHEGPALALARAHGLPTCWAVPIRGRDGQELGQLAVYGERRPVGARARDVVQQLADLAGLIVAGRQALAQLAQVAYHDPLTGLPNRYTFMLSLDRQLRAVPEGGELPETRVGLALIDLDSFRAINDAYGQATGDQLLQAVTARLQAALQGRGRDGRPEPLLARVGGDEFAVLIPQLDHEQELGALSSQLSAAIHAPLTVHGQEITLRGNIGWSLYPDLALDGEGLLAQADTALYTARQEGVTSRLYSLNGGHWTLSPSTIRTALERALEQGQLHLAYQPLVGRGGALRGFEALLRWAHPQYGTIGPDQFIPVAEMSGLIRHIGSWVLQEATRTALGWPDGTVVSVNISGRQFEHPEFIRELKAALAHSALPPQRLELELTESALMLNSARAERTLRQVKAMGVRVALDDYGVGYSNLGRLKLLDIDTIKIDRSFTRDLTASLPGQVNPDAAIVRSVVGLARDLGIEVVAEGVETQGHLNLLAQLGCETMQGYLFSRPLPAAEAQRWLIHWGRWSWLSGLPWGQETPPGPSGLDF